MPTALNGLAAEAQASDEGEVGTSFSGNGGSDGRSSGSDTDFRFVCINNNDNEVGGGTPPVPPVPPEDACLLCFEEISDELRDAIIAALVADGPLVIVPGVYEVPADKTTIEGLCEWLADNAPLFLTQAQINALVDSFINANPGLSRVEIGELLDCLIDARIIVVVPPAPPGGCPGCFTAKPDGIWPPGLLNNQFLPKIATGEFQLDGTVVLNVEDICEKLALDGTTTSEFETFLNAVLPGKANKNTIEDVIACLLATGDLSIG